MSEGGQAEAPYKEFTVNRGHNHFIFIENSEKWYKKSINSPRDTHEVLITIWSGLIDFIKEISKFISEKSTSKLNIYRVSNDLSPLHSLNYNNHKKSKYTTSKYD